MRISAGIMDLPGIEQASVLMGTPANMDLLVESGLIDVRPDTKPSDLVLVIKGKAESLDEAFVAAEAALSPRESSASGGNHERPLPTSLLSALEESPDANLAIVSTPGEFAGAEAMKALRAGLNVMLFSDNVSVDQEIVLKEYATRHDLLVMGPDCGTAIIGGAPLAFANMVRKGSIGIVGASGTGIQQVTCLIDQLGSGVSHAIGTGGRDLSKDIGGLTMLAGMQALADDPNTEVIVLISKPPSQEVARKVLDAASKTGTPTVINFLGADSRQLSAPGIYFASTLEEAAHIAVALNQGEPPNFKSAGPDNARLIEQAKTLVENLKPPQRFLRGLFTGGTFCYEAQLLLQDHLTDLFANSSTGKVQKLASAFHSVAHTLIDLGDDIFTRGKPHPMIDPATRNERVLQEIRDPETAVILLDVVLGYGSHEDPAGELARVIEEARAVVPTNPPVFIASVCGTNTDPQNFAQQQAKLEAQNVTLCASNAQAAILALLVAQWSIK
jgi:succinyl-CoA synthetase alpha subunit